MSAAEIIAGALNTEIVGHTGDANGGRITRQTAQEFGRISIAALEEAGYATVKLPSAENYGEQDMWTTEHGTVSVDAGTIRFEDDVLVIQNPAEAHELAAALLAAANRLEALWEAEARA